MIRENNLIDSFQVADQLRIFLSEGKIDIYCPFISQDTLVSLYDVNEEIRRITVRWRKEDFESGVADLDLYRFCKDRAIQLYINHRIHLKAILKDNDSVFFGSANLTDQGINLNEVENFNFELSYIKENLQLIELSYFESIIQDSIYVDDEIFNSIQRQLGEVVHSDKEKFDLPDSKYYYISQLPITYNPLDLFNYYKANITHKDNIYFDCALHDLSIYKVTGASNLEEFKAKLFNSFINHPFILNLIGHLSDDGYLYFGAVKQWIQENCLDTPVPRRKELTETVQTLYNWIDVLGSEYFIVDRPRHSQRIRIIKEIF
ncbi:phospholipase D-like domain-containing protein [Balneola sp. MJW-20]|uniref:phospholipase D-like domain-containing protein n=1 Tax=Gracilimonas aurantiaca TaxID=3234185 RepID=UPI003464F2C1